MLMQTTVASAMLKVEVVKEAVPKAVSPEIAKLLAAECYQVTDGPDSLRFWVRKAVPAKAAAAPVAYSKVEEGTVLGVLEIKGETWTDFRAQELPEGVFVVRLIFQPQDGDHMGVAPFPEFVALTPPGADKDPKSLSHDDVAKLSAETIDTGHPAVLFLNPYLKEPDFEFPVVNKNDYGHTVLNVQTEATITDGKTVPFRVGLIIIGVSDDA